jgi:ADP-ribose pyrophosphatase
MQLTRWKKLESSPVLSAPPWLTVYRERVELPDGRTLDDFYRVILPEFAVAVPVTEAGEMVMIRSYKHGAERVTVSAPAGLLNPGESPLQAAQRELLEETGYSSREWHDLGSFVVDGNRQCGTAHLFLARNVSQMIVPNNPDPYETVEVALMSPHDFFQAVREGEVALLATVSAVSLAMLAQKGVEKNQSLTE